MKKNGMIALAILTLLIVSTVPVSARADGIATTGWRIMQVDATGGTLSSIAVDSLGNPHISYYEPTGAGAMYASYDGTKWNLEPMTGAPGAPISLALDKNNVPHLSITAAAANSTHNSWYGNKTGGVWKYAIVDSNDSYGDSIAIDNNGDVQIAYNAAGVWYAKLVDGKFVKSWVDHDGYSSIDPDRAIAIDSNGNPHIVYRNWNPSLPSNTVHYASLDNGSWNLSLVDKYGEGFAAICIENTTAYIGYSSDLNMSYSHWDGSGWKNEMIDNEIGEYTSIATNSTGGLWISYIDTKDANHLKLKCAHQNGTGWINDTIDVANGSNHQMSHTSLAIDKFGYSHIAYNEPGFGLLYATNKPAGVQEISTIIIPSIALIALFVIVLKRKKNTDHQQHY